MNFKIVVIHNSKFIIKLYLCNEDSERKLHLTAIVDRSRSTFVFYSTSFKKVKSASQERWAANSL